MDLPNTVLPFWVALGPVRRQDGPRRIAQLSSAQSLQSRRERNKLRWGCGLGERESYKSDYEIIAVDRKTAVRWWEKTNKDSIKKDHGHVGEITITEGTTWDIYIYVIKTFVKYTSALWVWTCLYCESVEWSCYNTFTSSLWSNLWTTRIHNANNKVSVSVGWWRLCLQNGAMAAKCAASI